MKRTTQLISMMLLALLLASGMALAAVKVGTNGQDILKGTNSRDKLVGKGGNDILYGKGGSDDYLKGPIDQVSSYVKGGLYGGPGNDRIFGGGGDDWLAGGGGKDVLRGGSGTDRGDAGPGNDIVYLGTDNDGAERPRRPCPPVCFGAGSSPGFAGDYGSDVMYGEEGNDYLLGDTAEQPEAQQRPGVGGDDTLYGGPGRDDMTGGNGRDRIFGGIGDDFIIDGPFDSDRDTDYLFGGDGNDHIVAWPHVSTPPAPEPFRDVIFCGDGTDSVDADILDYVASDCEKVRLYDPADYQDFR